MTTKREPDAAYEEKGEVLEKNAGVGVSSLFAPCDDVCPPKSSFNSHEEDAQGDGSDGEDEEDGEEQEENPSENNNQESTIVTSSSSVKKVRAENVNLDGRRDNRKRQCGIIGKPSCGLAFILTLLRFLLMSKPV